MKKVISYILLMAIIVVLVPFAVIQLNGKEGGPVQVPDKVKSNTSTEKPETAITINVYMHTQKKTVENVFGGLY
ncbi:hypothetical protein [Ruminiclostridium papyrosolvens]|uniref:hypothetical protein n=1 Tax=Ruminiclostridium papyrosolvens TaxID=29362 RepID=UPI00040487EE|nr:hypothetical protein [Ruminiclostridium papyrosolvens]